MCRNDWKIVRLTGSRSITGASCNIVVNVTPVLVPFHIVLLDQSIPVSTIPQSHKDKVTYLSMFFLISAGSSTPLVFVAEMTSLTNSACVMLFLLFMILTTAAWVSKLRSAATRSWVCWFSCLVSFAWIWLILMRYLGCVKPRFAAKVSVSLTSLPLGSLLRTRYLAQASDWSVRLSSVSSRIFQHSHRK